MDFWINIILFTIILIFYLHLQNEWKKSEDLEIFEMDYISNKDLQEVCNFKQPVIFQMDNKKDLEPLFHWNPDEKQEIIMKDIRDYYKSSDIKSVNGISLSYKSAIGLCNTDPSSYFFSENNIDIIPKTVFDTLSYYLSPPLTISCKYDYWFGSANTITPVRYHCDTSRFLLVLPGQGIRVKMSPWRTNSVFSPIKDYENYDFWSKTNIWKDVTLKCLEFDVKPGYILYIPSYWFYSIQYIQNNVSEETETKVSSIAYIQYITGMNMIANIHHYGLYFLQQQNIMDTKSRILKPVTITEEIPEPKQILEEINVKTDVSESIAMLQPKTEII
jgi:hypothetical protein